jgi:ribosome maturation factor RimP
MSVLYRDEEGNEVELSGHLLEVPRLEEERPWIVIMPEKNKKKGHQPKMEGITLYLDQVIRAVPEAEL